MENEKPFLAEIKNDLSEYIDLRARYLKLDAFEKISKLSSALFTVFIVAFLALFGILFLSITMAAYLSKLLESNIVGYGIVAAFFIGALLLYYVFGKTFIERKITNKVIEILANDEE
jgi:uncharacterized membrane protein YdbT with pleckstrin-like domain